MLQQAFTSTVARGLSLVAIVVSGLTFSFGEDGSERVLAGSSSASTWPLPQSTFSPGSLREVRIWQDPLKVAGEGKGPRGLQK